MNNRKKNDLLLLTKSSIDLIKKKIESLNLLRIEIIERITDTPRTDLSENSERELLMQDDHNAEGQILKLTNYLENSQLFVKDPSSSLVQIESVVSYLEIRGDSLLEKEVTISDFYQNDHAQKKVSYLSPLGRALFLKGVDDQEVVTVSLTDSSKNYSIKIKKIV